MKRVVAAAALVLAWAGNALGYNYDYQLIWNNSGVNSSNGSGYNDLGDPSIGTYDTVRFTSGSVMLIPALPGNSSDHDTESVISLGGGNSGTFIHFLRASSTTVQSGSGSYISVELSGSQLVVNQCVNGAVTQLAATSVSMQTGMKVRTVIWGTTLRVYIANPGSGYGEALTQQVAAMTGTPGFGGSGMPVGSGFYWLRAGHRDATAPTPVSVSSVVNSTLASEVSLRWQGTADDVNGAGVWRYLLTRNGGAAVGVLTYEFTDTTGIQPSTTYTYQIGAEDWDGNVAWTTIPVTTPPANTVDPRRVGLRVTGSYWGGGGEQLDTLSGNLNYTIPLGEVGLRAGGRVPIALSYNSQNWKQHGGNNWQMAGDVGYGFGWKLQIGSLTPYYASWLSGVDHYTFTDGSGAEYRLGVNTNGVWSSNEGIHVWFDSNTNKLYFRDGTYWVMGCTSAGNEPDAGTMYPTIIEDPHGNQIIAAYKAAVGLAAYLVNTSARMTSIAGSNNTLTFYWNSDAPVPHLLSVVGTNLSFVMSYSNGVALSPPFGADASYAGITTSRLAGIAPSTGGTYGLAYDSAGAVELTQVTFPTGGHLRWVYGNDGYNGSRTQRAVTTRYLAADSGGATEWTYNFTRDNASGGTVHSSATLADASGIGTKTWNFTASSGAPVWQLGLVSDFAQAAAQGGTVLKRDSYGWSLDGGGKPYISVKSAVLNEGTGSASSARTEQTQDPYGNVTQTKVYSLNSTTSVMRTYNSTYLTGATYTSRYMFNRLLSATVTAGGVTTALVTNTYDQYTFWGAGVQNTPGVVTGRDANGAYPANARGLATTMVSPAETLNTYYYDIGTPYNSSASDGRTATFLTNASVNYAAPTNIATESYNESMSYTYWLGLTQKTGSNGEQLSMTYDSYGRPTTGTSPFGAVTTYTYSGAGVLPAWQKVTTDANQGYTKTTVDGLGRAIQVERGANSTPVAFTDTQYAPCSCSPMGKLSKTSLPYAPGGTPVWTVYTYDGLGRTLAVKAPDGASTSTYSYAGAQTTAYDAKGNWKAFSSDALGNMSSVVEPDPANSAGTLVSSYSYDWMNHVSQVSAYSGAR